MYLTFISKKISIYLSIYIYISIYLSISRALCFMHISFYSSFPPVLSFHIRLSVCVCLFPLSLQLPLLKIFPGSSRGFYPLNPIWPDVKIECVYTPTLLLTLCCLLIVYYVYIHTSYICMQSINVK